MQVLVGRQEPILHFFLTFKVFDLNLNHSFLYSHLLSLLALTADLLNYSLHLLHLGLLLNHLLSLLKTCCINLLGQTAVASLKLAQLCAHFLHRLLLFLDDGLLQFDQVVLLVGLACLNWLWFLQ